MRKMLRSSVVAAAMAGLVFTGAGSASAASGATVSNWCMWTNLSVKVQTVYGQWQTLSCNSTRREVIAVRSIHPTKVSTTGICLPPGQVLYLGVGKERDVYTVPSC